MTPELITLIGKRMTRPAAAQELMNLHKAAVGHSVRRSITLTVHRRPRIRTSDAIFLGGVVPPTGTSASSSSTFDFSQAITSFSIIGSTSKSALPAR